MNMRKPADNIVFAKSGVNIVFENSFSSIRKKLFLLLFLYISKRKKHFAKVLFSFENVCKVARSSQILFPLSAMRYKMPITKRILYNKL